MGSGTGYHESAGLQLSIHRAIELSIYRLSSVDVRVASSVYHQSSMLSFHLYSSLPCLRWRLVDGCCLLTPHPSGVVVGRRDFATAVCDACRDPLKSSVDVQKPLTDLPLTIFKEQSTCVKTTNRPTFESVQSAVYL